MDKLATEGENSQSLFFFFFSFFFGQVTRKILTSGSGYDKKGGG